MATKKVKKKQIKDFKHDIRHEHLDATGDDKGKWIRANPDTGGIEYTEAPKDDKHLTVPISHSIESVVQHNMNKHPAIQVKSGDDDIIISDIQHIDANNTKLTFETYFTGTVIFN